MSLGSRIASRGKAAICASLASTPREPLLFLYPQWIRKSSTAASDTAFTQLDSHSIASNQIATRNSTTTNPAAESGHATSAKVLSHLPEDGRSSALSMTNQTAHEPAVTIETPKYTTSGSRNFRDSSRRGQTQEYIALPIEKKVRKILSNAALSEQTQRSKFSVRKAYQSYKREELRSWLPDWRVILADLVKHTPQHGKWLDKAIVVTVPEDSMAQLFNGLDDNIWDIGGRYDCSIGLGPRDKETASHRAFLLSGSSISISKTTADLIRICPNAEIKASSKPPRYQGDEKSTSVPAIHANYTSRSRDGTVRNVIAKGRHAGLNMQAQKVPRPVKWDTASFHDYVCNLTYSEVPNHLHRFMYEKGEDHTTTVVNILRSLFADPQCKPFISRAACNEVMAYFVKTNRIEDARVLFVHMEMLNLRMDPEIFNTMLRGAAKSNDLHNFHFVLHLMLRRGFSPNAKTWIAFMKAVKDMRIQLYILAAMKDKGLLQHLPSLRGACELLAIPELESSLNQSQSQEGFLTHMDSRYGPNWLNVATGNHILHALGARGLISRCWEFLLVMDSRLVKPDNISVNTILHHCKQGSNLAGAVEVLKVLPQDSNFVPDDETYRILFEMAWRSKSYNLARVVWRYACLSAATTFRMRTLVLESLRCTSSQASRNRFNELAGEVIIGLHHSGEHPVQFFVEGMSGVGTDLRPGTNDIESPPVNLVTTSNQAPVVLNADSRPARRIQLERAILLTNADYKVFQDWEAVKPLSEMLVEALERDQAWKSAQSHAKVKKGLDWMLGNAISVPLRSKSREIGIHLEWK